MNDAKKREADFRKDLDALLKKHKAELDITDDGEGYGMQSGVAEVTMDAEYDSDGNIISEYSWFLI